jgi:predicted dehydrogenase
MKEVGFAIVGLGNIAPVHAASIEAIKGARLVAVCDTRAELARNFARQYGGTAYSDLAQMLKHPGLDAVSLCVPSGLRAELAVAVARAGKHIMSEKPLEITTARVDRILRACDKSGVLLGCIFQYRFAEAAQHVRKAIDQGRFGKLVLGDAYIKWYRSQEYYDSGAWRGTWEFDGGGALMNQGIHQIDLLQWFMGPVRRVYARTATVAHKNIEVEDLATVLVEFASGAQGVIEASTASFPGHPARVEVHGTQGSAVIEDGKLVFWEFAKKRAEDRKIAASMKGESELGTGASDPLKGLKIEGHRRQIEDFVRAIRTGRPPAISGREGRKAIVLLDAIYKSARTGRTIDLK